MAEEEEALMVNACGVLKESFGWERIGGDERERREKDRRG